MDGSVLTSDGIRVSASGLDLDAYRRDLWPRATLNLVQQGAVPPRPQLVTWPQNSSEVARVLSWAREEGVAVVPYGAGSGVCGAAAGMEGSVVLDTKRMGRVLDIDPEARTVRVECGMLGQHLEDALAEHGWMTAHSPSSIMCSTVGGYLASRSAGQFSSRYGVFDDIVLAARAQTPAGPLSMGQWGPEGQEDLLPVFCGSEGALGVATEVLLRIVPLPQTRWLRGFAFETLEEAWEAMRRIMQAGLWPSALRLYDPVDTRIGGRAGERAEEAAGVVTKLKRAIARSPTLRRHLLDIPFALPTLINRLAANLGREVLLIVGFEGSEELVSASVEASRPILSSARDLGAGPGEHWFRHRHDVSYKLAPAFAVGGFGDTMEVAAPWSRLPELHTQVREALGNHALVMAHFSHAYPEGCSIYFSFIGAGNVEVYDAAWAEGLRAVAEAGGTVAHHHGVGQLKAKAAAQEQGAAVRVWNEIRAAWDPSGIMNPGRQLAEPEPDGLGPSSPGGGPVFALDERSLLAEVDPAASPGSLQEALVSQGYQLRLVPDRPLGQWLPELERGVLQPWQTPLFAVQARFDDGVAVRLGPAPRSAAGPDLRWGLMRRAKTEMVQVSVRPLEQDVVDVSAPSVERCLAWRPAWSMGSTWCFGSGGKALADGVGGKGAPSAEAPVVSPHLPTLRAEEDGGSS